VGRWPRNGIPIPVAGKHRFVHTAAVKSRICFAVLVLASIASSARAEIFRCTGSGGRITYQEVPCGSAEQSRTMDIPAAFPEVNNVERNRLLQREAALDARLIERSRIESAERIARAELAAREREAEAAREAAAAAAQAYAPAFGYWPVYRQPPRIRHHILRGPPPQRL